MEMSILLALGLLLTLMIFIGFSTCVLWLYRTFRRPPSAACATENAPGEPEPEAIPRERSATGNSPADDADAALSAPTPPSLLENHMSSDLPSSGAGNHDRAAANSALSAPSASTPAPKATLAAAAPARAGFAALDVMRSTGIRFAVVGAVMLALFIPIGFVRGIVDERAELYDSVVKDISATWGGPQNVAGPLLVVPFTENHIVERRVRNENRPADAPDAYSTVKRSEQVLNHMVILPRSVRFDGTLAPEERKRGIYRSLVYTADLALNGVFVLPTSEEWARVAPALHEIDYRHAYVIMGLSWPNALRSVSPFIWDGEELRAEPGARPMRMANGFRVPVSVDARRAEHEFSQKLVFNGSAGLRLTPVGEVTEISLTSPWPSPSFRGDVLPATREVGEDGFRASWNVPSLARSFPNLAALDEWPSGFTEFRVGVDLFETSTQYQLIHRAVKYGILFIGLTFLAFIVLDLGLRARLHPVQYGLVGLAMVVFYLSLLSLAEHVAFGTAYAAASACAILMISLYAAAALRARRLGLGAGVLLTALYTLLYAILQMEDYALLMGTALVLIMLGALMYVSRNIARQGA